MPSRSKTLKLPHELQEDPLTQNNRLRSIISVATKYEIGAEKL